MNSINELVDSVLICYETVDSLPVMNVWGPIVMPDGLSIWPQKMWSCILVRNGWRNDLWMENSDYIQLIVVVYKGEPYYLDFGNVYDVYGDPWGYESNYDDYTIAETCNLYYIPNIKTFTGRAVCLNELEEIRDPLYKHSTKTRWIM